MSNLGPIEISLSKSFGKISKKNISLNLELFPTLSFESEKGSAFDYNSIMLYQTNTFALRPELFSMRSIGPEQVSPVQDGLSAGDIRRINRLFHLAE